MIRQKLTAFCGLDENAQALLGLYCRGAVSGTQLADWLAGVDFEALPPDISCLAAAAGADGNDTGVAPALIPRLKGIRKYVHTLNAGQLAGVCALAADLTRAGIPVLLLEDTALYMAQPDAARRHLWQTIIGVPAADYAQSLDIARQAGFELTVFQGAANARQGVLRQITIVPRAPSDYLWQGAEALKKGGADFLCPDSAALVIGLGRRTFRALTKADPRAAIVRWCMDMKLLLPLLSEADWQRIRRIAAEENARLHMGLLFTLYEAVTGRPPAPEGDFGSRKELDRLLSLLQAYRRCDEKGASVRRRFLLYRLRRPDSLRAAAALMLRQGLGKLGF